MHENRFSDPTGGAHDAPPVPLIGWGGGNPLPIPHLPRRLRRLSLVAPANWGECLHPSKGMEGPDPYNNYYIKNYNYID